MAKWLNCFGLVVLGLVGQVTAAFASDFPEPVGFVNDFAGVLSSETKQALEQQLVQLEEDSSIEIAVVTVESLQETTVEELAVRLFEDWRIGKKTEDSGVLFLIVPSEKQMKIEVGYGLEPVLPDAKAGRILDTYVVPAFREGDYDKGISEGTEAIIKTVHGEEIALVDKSESSGIDAEEDGMWVLFFIGVIFLSYLSSFLARSKRWWPGGIIGAVLGIILGGFLASLIISVLAAIGLGILGLIFDFILSRNYKKRKAGGLPTSWWGSGGGFFGGSAKGGSGGGFGGFGGGSSGGGGASRGW